MNELDITFGRALKVWWSYAWRAFVLWIPVGLAIAISMFWIFPFPRPGQGWTPSQVPAMMANGFLIWIMFMAAAIVVQTIAMRWMLKTRWADFRLVAVSGDESR